MAFVVASGSRIQGCRLQRRGGAVFDLNYVAERNCSTIPQLTGPVSKLKPSVAVRKRNCTFDNLVATENFCKPVALCLLQYTPINQSINERQRHPGRQYTFIEIRTNCCRGGWVVRPMKERKARQQLQVVNQQHASSSSYVFYFVFGIIQTWSGLRFNSGKISSLTMTVAGLSFGPVDALWWPARSKVGKGTGTL